MSTSLNIYSFITTHKHLSSVPSLSRVEELILSHIHGRGPLSQFYNLVLTSSKDSSINKLEAWKGDLQEDIQVAEWENVFVLRPRRSLLTTNIDCYSTSGFMQTYPTQRRLGQMFPNIPEFCVKCRE